MILDCKRNDNKRHLSKEDDFTMIMKYPKIREGIYDEKSKMYNWTDFIGQCWNKGFVLDLDLDFFKIYSKYFDTGEFVRRSKFNFTIEFLELAGCFNYNLLLEYCIVTKGYIEKNFEKIDWDFLSNNLHLPKDAIMEYGLNINWECFNYNNRNFDIECAKRYHTLIDVERAFYNKNITEYFQKALKNGEI